jgi:hypothetical protein
LAAARHGNGLGVFVLFFGRCDLRAIADRLQPRSSIRLHHALALLTTKPLRVLRPGAASRFFLTQKSSAQSGIGG